MIQESPATTAAPVQTVGLALLGAGVVGSGVTRVLATRGHQFAERHGVRLDLVGVAVRDASRQRDGVSPNLLTTDAHTLIRDPHVEIVVEVMGGLSPAGELVADALQAGKHVVTANKELIATRGAELHRLAAQHNVCLLYEASAGGGIPLIAPLRESLAANQVNRIRAIINGTTNYILTRMARDGVDFADALAEAQRLGYAEADPTADVEGIDAAYKLSILASIALGQFVSPEAISRQGISSLAARDFRYAAELGYAIKLLAVLQRNDGSFEARVHPALVPLDRLLARVDGVFNAIEIDADLAGEVVFYGRGAGPEPTASAVLGDVLAIAAGRGTPPAANASQLSLQPVGQARTRYYLRLGVVDRPGVLAQLAQILGDNQISIASVLQKERDEAAGTAEIVMMTHPADDPAMARAIGDMQQLDTVAAVASAIRVEE